MKKTFSIFLILSFLFNAAGYLLIYSLLQSHLKEIAEENISTGRLVNKVLILAFSKTDINEVLSELRFLDKKEFSYKGKMYDVIKKECVNDSIYFYCLPDADEDELNLAFNKNFDGDEQNSDKNSPRQNLLKNILQDGVLSDNPILMRQFSKTNYFTHKSITALSNIYEVVTPPPVSLSV